MVAGVAAAPTSLRRDKGREMLEEAHVPSFIPMAWPTLQALRELGGSGTIQELNAKVGKSLRLNEAQLQRLHGEGPETELANRAGWARTYLGKIGAVTRSDRGVWAITELGKNLTQTEVLGLIKKVRAEYRRARRKRRTAAGDDDVETEDTWKKHLIEAIRGLSDGGFERLCQRVLREKGLTDVLVTGRHGDQGIDGTGVLTVGGLLSFRVVFQAKKWKHNVGPEVVGRLRGDMQGKAEKGLVITTAQFTPGAIEQATRTPPTIDLIDGDQLCELMRELGLGVREEVRAIPSWFEEFEDERRTSKTQSTN